MGRAVHSRPALKAGKHVLCEKPFAASATDAAACFDAAEAAGRVCAEGFMWRTHPQTLLARRLVADGAVGQPATIRASLRVAVDAGDIRRSPELGGGALGDLGCYCVSAIRLLGGDPVRVTADAYFDEVDIRIGGVLQCRGGVLGVFDCGLDLPPPTNWTSSAPRACCASPTPGCAPRARFS